MYNVTFILRLLAALLLLMLVQPTRAETLMVAGTGSSAPLVQLLFEAFHKQAPDAILKQINPPLGSGGAIKALAAGKIDLAFSGRTPNRSEVGSVGRSFELGRTAFVFASSDGLRKGGFTADDLAAVYAGRLKTWENGRPVRLILRSAFESDTQTVRAISPELDSAVSEAIKQPGMVVGKDDLDTLELLTRTSGSLATVTMGLLRSTGSRLIVFPYNGVTPTLANLRNGSYPLSKSLFVILPQQASTLAVRFVDFLHSPVARELLLRNDYLLPD